MRWRIPCKNDDYPTGCVCVCVCVFSLSFVNVTIFEMQAYHSNIDDYARLSE